MYKLSQSSSSSSSSSLSSLLKVSKVPTTTRSSFTSMQCCRRRVTRNAYLIGAVFGIVVIATSNSFLVPPSPSHVSNIDQVTRAAAATRRINKKYSSRVSFAVENDESVGDSSALSDVPLRRDEAAANEECIEDTFDMHVGRALDALRNDYPRLLTDSPDYALYDDDIDIIDPSGVRLHGLKNYKNAFRLVHAIVNVFYCPERSGLTFRLCYDKARHNIRVQWNAEVIPKAIFGGVRTTLYVDGISVYELSSVSGKIEQHRIERLLINDLHVQPQQGIVAALRREHQSLPVFSTGGQLGGAGNEVVEFQDWNTQYKNKAKEMELTTSLFTMSSSATGEESNSGDGDNANDDAICVDYEALERKNASRKKFGLKPLSVEEFIQVEKEVAQLDRQQRQAAAAAAAAADVAKKQKEERPGFMEKIFGNVMKDTCESNYDCVRPEVCCDFGFKKMCCASGMKIGPQRWKGELATVPVPVAGYPPNRGPNDLPQGF